MVFSIGIQRMDNNISQKGYHKIVSSGTGNGVRQFLSVDANRVMSVTQVAIPIDIDLERRSIS